MTRPTKEVYARYHAKTYNIYSIALRKEDDAALIRLIEDNKAAGISPTATVRELYKAYMAAYQDYK